MFRTGTKYEMIAWASYQIRNIAGCACAGNAGNVFTRRRLQRKPLVSDPGMHHGTCVTHVPWCMSGSLASGGGENVPGIPGACAPAIFCIWQEAHGSVNDKIMTITYLKSLESDKDYSIIYQIMVSIGTVHRILSIQRNIIFKMTSSNGNIFSVTGHL